MTEAASKTKGTGRAAEGSSPLVFIVAGEASGDWAGARLARALVEKAPGLRLEGVGGRWMAEAGVELLADSSGWGAIGVVDALRKVPRVWRAVREVRSRLEGVRPSAVVLIDSGGVNVPLARMLGKLNLRIVYYLPPGSWRKRLKNQGLRDLVDVIATPFSWSRELLVGGRARVEWVGHPVVEAARPRLSRQQAWQQYGLDPARPVVAMAPGSREQEMRYVLPVLAEAAARLAAEITGVQFLAPVSERAYEERVRAAFQRSGARVTVLGGMEYDALQLAGAAAVCSGTATLEFACLGVPIVIVYRASAATTVQYVLMRGLIGGQKRAGMPNIIAGREIVPELLGRHAKPGAVAQELHSLLRDEGRRERMKADLAEVVANLGGDPRLGGGPRLGDDPRLGGEGASGRTADLVLGLMGQEKALDSGCG